MKRGEILDSVKKTITQDRNNRHGEPENSFPRIAQVWTDYLVRNTDGAVSNLLNLKPSDVAEMLAIFKTVRFEMQPDNPDNEHDRIGYYAIAAELRATERQKAEPPVINVPVNEHFPNQAKPGQIVEVMEIDGKLTGRKYIWWPDTGWSPYQPQRKEP